MDYYEQIKWGIQDEPVSKDVPTAVLSPHTSKRWCNAHVFRTQDKQGQEWVVKDFSPCSLLVRHTAAQLLLSREIHALRYIWDIKGIPGPIIRRGKWAFAYPYIPGTTLSESMSKKERIGEHYFKALEDLVTQMHDNGVAHLDLRNKNNILVTPRREPAIIDFQSAVFTNHLPSHIRNILFAIDLSGVYKYWAKITPETLTHERRETAQRIESLRRFWILKGYPLRKRSRRSLYKRTNDEQS